MAGVQPKVSIIVPCYNGEDYFPCTLPNIQEQTLSDFEVIFVDDGSDDNTNPIIRDAMKNDERIKLITIPKNVGAGNARNIGLSRAKGDYVIFLDVDDVYDINLLEKCYNCAKETGADITLFQVVLYDMANQTLIDSSPTWLWNPPYPIKKIFTPLDVKGNLFSFCKGAVWNKFYKRSLLVENNLFFLNIPKNNDSYFVYRSYLVAKTMYVMDDVLLAYSINNPDSITIQVPQNVQNPYELINNKLIIQYLEENGLYDTYENAIKHYWDVCLNFR